MNITSKDLKTIIYDIAGIIENNLDYLTELDASIGDGDHGINMNKGFNKIKKESPEDIRDILAPSVEKNGDTWIDVCGLICRKSRIENLISGVTSGKIDTFDKTHSAKGSGQVSERPSEAG